MFVFFKSGICIDSKVHTTRMLAATCKLASTRLQHLGRNGGLRLQEMRNSGALTGLTHRLLTLLLTALKNTSIFINVIVYFFELLNQRRKESKSTFFHDITLPLRDLIVPHWNYLTHLAG